MLVVNQGMRLPVALRSVREGGNQLKVVSSAETGASSVLTFECQVEHDVVDQSADADPVEFDDP